MRKLITFEEYSHRDEEITSEEYDILSEQFKKYIEIIEIGNGKYRIKTTQYIGNIVLPEHIIIINPKIKNLNFSYMLSYVYDLDPFQKEDFEYLREKEKTIFEQIIRNLLDRIERLCKRGISKSYYENEENLPYVKGKILLRENLSRNTLLQHRVFCRFSEFGSDNTENRIIKYTLYWLSKMKLEDKDLHRKVRFLLHYFEPVSITPSIFDVIPTITYDRLNKHYKSIINVCKLILTNSSLNFGTRGEVKFSSFLIDMNDLFERFIVGILGSRLNRKAFNISKEIGYSDIQSLTEIKPDIIIRNNQGKRLLVMDAKYKDEVTDDDLNQMWIYCIALSLSVGILVYPKHAKLSSGKRTLLRTNIDALIVAIDLNKSKYQEFEEECNRFVTEIGRIIQGYNIL
jgi:5-methylcytosine-specific restriction enzyme subunit McrC